MPSQPALSPDGAQVVFTLKTSSVDKDGYRRSLWGVPADGSAPATRIVLISGTPDRVIAAQEADAGAVALLAKETPPATICAELVAAGEGRVGRAVE